MSFFGQIEKFDIWSNEGLINEYKMGIKYEDDNIKLQKY